MDKLAAKSELQLTAERLAEQIKSQLGQQGMGGGTGDDDDDDEEEEEEEEGGDNEDEENGGAEEENDKKSFEVKTELQLNTKKQSTQLLFTSRQEFLMA